MTAVAGSAQDGQPTVTPASIDRPAAASQGNTAPDTSRRPGRRWLNALVRSALAWTVIIAVWANIGSHLVSEYDRALTGSMTEGANQARVVESMTIRVIDAVDQVLLLTRDLYGRDPASFNLVGWARDSPFLNDFNIQLAIANETGLIVASNLGLATGSVSIADRAHFQAHAKPHGTEGTRASDRLFISQPVVGRVSGRTSVQFTRAILGPDGQFRGVVVASLDPRTIGQLYGSIGVTRDIVVLFGLDGVARAGSPGNALAARTLPDPILLAAARAEPHGAYRSGDEDTGRIVAFRRVGAHPVVVAVEQAVADALARYRDDRAQYLMIGIGLTVLVLCLQAVDMIYRRRVRRFQDALTVTLDNMSQGIIMVDQHQHVPVINRRTAELLGLPPEIARPGADFRDILRWQVSQGEFAAVGAEQVAALVRRGGLDATLPVYERTRPTGEVLEVRTAVLPNGAAVRTYTDITDRRRFEQALAAARDAAEAGSRARSEFLTMMSHEIRTPLNGVLGSAGLLRGLALSPEADHYAHIIEQAGGHLLMLVDDILDFTRLDTGRLSLEHAGFDLANLVQGVVDIMAPEARAKGLTLALEAPDLPGEVVGDAGRLRQVLLNLVGNAIKFTARGGVRLAARATREDGGHVRLAVSVHDTGMGIPAEKCASLFEAFTQVDGSLSRRFEGTGLGLAICNQLVKLMDGSISVESRPDEGSVFRFDVRLTAAATAETPAPAPPSPAPALRVLIAEDNPTNRLVATRMVTRLGHHADTVEDGAEAVATLRQTPYDVVLMDLMMPGMDGLAATRAIRAEADPLRAMPIIGLTANAQAEDEAACLAAGMDAFLTKPVSVERLSLALRAVVGPKVAAEAAVTASSLPNAGEGRYPDSHPG